MPVYPNKTLKRIKYDSPSGYINIGKWIPPFMPVKNGQFGFMGILAEDVKSGKLQCHICGEWYKMLSTHVFAKHNLKQSKYQQKFGLLVSTCLQTMKIRKDRSDLMTKMRKDHPRKMNAKGTFEKNNTLSANRKGKKKALESQNKYGVCELQMEHKIKTLARKLGKTPTLTDILNHYGQGTVSLIGSRYSSYVAYCKKINLIPNWSNANPKYSKKYFKDKMLAAKKAKIPLTLESIFTESESRNMYKYYKNGMKSLKKACKI